MGEGSVRMHDLDATTLQHRLPGIWAAFTDGAVPTQNAREAASLVRDLPEPGWAAFESAVLGFALLAPARFKRKAAALARRLGDAAQRERVRRARGVWCDPGPDGMGFLSASLPNETLAAAQARLDAAAFQLFKRADEERTMDQLRADILGDWLTGAGTDAPVGVTVALTVPMLSLLGASDAPAVLEGVGPIDLETARRLTAETPSLTRLLTDPVSGAILTMDARQYTPTAALRRWLRHRDVTCTFPGCGRSAARCDLDHVTAWSDHGTTTADNLAHLCRKHHTLKHQSRWQVERADGRTTWSSPTGYRVSADPPPF